MDRDGRDIYYFYDPKTYSEDKMEKDVEADSILLEEHYNTKVHKIPLDSEGKFVEEWNNMPNDKIDAVVIYSHSNPDRFVIGTDVLKEKGEYGDYDERLLKEQIGELDSKNINTLILLGCNTGYTNTNDNIATRFIDDENQLNIQTVIASDGQVYHRNFIDIEKKWFFFEKEVYRHELESKLDDKRHPDGNNMGFKVYYYVEEENDGVKELKLHYPSIGYKFNNITDLVEAAEECIG